MPRVLNTIQKIEKLNTVRAIDNEGPGGANHIYDVIAASDGGTQEYSMIIKFQKGPRKDPSSSYGVLDTDLLEIVRDRLKGFQKGDFATEDNAKALEHIEIALMYMNKRVMDRYERNVLGTYEK